MGATNTGQIEAMTAANDVLEGPRAWKMLFCVWLTLVVLWGGGFNTFGVFFNPILKSFGWSHAQVASLTTVLCFVMAVFGPIGGWIIEHTKIHCVMAGGTILVILSYLWAGTAESYSSMIGAFALLGLGLAFASIVPCNVVASKWFDQRRGAALGIAISGTAAGGLTVIPIAAYLTSAYGWRTTFFLLAVPTLVIALPLTLFAIREPRGAAATPHEVGAGTPEGLEIGEGLRSLTFWLLATIYFFYTFSVGIPLAHVIPYLIGLGYQSENAAMVMSLTQGMAFVGCIVSGFLGDKLGGKLTLAAVLVSAAFGLLALLGAHNVGWVVVFVLCVGVTLASAGALSFLLMTEGLGLKHHSFFSGVVSFIGFVAIGVSPFIGGRIIDVTGDYSKAFELGSACALGAAIVVVFVPKTRFRRGAAGRSSPLKPSGEYSEGITAGGAVNPT
jgi:predicted MFS family arabinose efflux permease